MEYLPSYMNNLVLNDENFENTNIITGGYPMLNILEYENQSNEILGGAKRVGIDRFKDLAIPFSLDTHYDGNNNIANIKQKKEKAIHVIEDGLFDKLMDSIIITKKRKEKETRRNNQVKITKSTRKSSIK
jgi:hypothetical protein